MVAIILERIEYMIRVPLIDLGAAPTIFPKKIKADRNFKFGCTASAKPGARPCTASIEIQNSGNEIETDNFRRASRKGCREMKKLKYFITPLYELEIAFVSMTL